MKEVKQIVRPPKTLRQPDRLKLNERLERERDWLKQQLAKAKGKV